MFSTRNNFNYNTLKNNTLEAFFLVDRFLLILVITLSLLLGLLVYLKKDTTQIYLVVARGITTFWVRKTSENFYSNFVEKTFLITWVIFMGCLWFLTMENKSLNILFEISVLLIIETSESLLNLYLGWFILGISILLDDGFRNLRYLVAHVISVYELFNTPYTC